MGSICCAVAALGLIIFGVFGYLGAADRSEIAVGQCGRREQQIGGSGGSLEPHGPLLEPPGPLLTHLHTVYMAHSERLPTRVTPLVERTCFSQVRGDRDVCLVRLRQLLRFPWPPQS